MEDSEGTDGTEEDGCRAGGWFHVEAIITHGQRQVSSDEDEDCTETGEDVDFIDNRVPGDGQEIPLQLYTQQIAQDDEATVQALKRKFVASPLSACSCIENDLSPRLDAISLNRKSEKAKRRLFETEPPDSGYGNTQMVVGTPEEVTGDENSEGGRPVEDKEEERQGGDGEADLTVQTPQSGTDAAGSVLTLLRSSNLKATLLSKFKELFGVGYYELVRQFKSSKTACADWVVCAFGVYYAVAEGIKQLIQPHTQYAHIQILTCSWGMVVFMLLRYNCAKNRDTVSKNMSMLLNIPEKHMLIEPPKLRSTPAALYWYKTAMGNGSEVYGETPEWIVRQTLVGHSMEDEQFRLSVMVQFAYDHDIVEESVLAFEYAQLADVDANAAAFLNSNCQAKYVKDAVTMCRHYKRAERAQMSMSQWITVRGNKVLEEGDWKPIVKFLRHQGVEFVSFLAAFKLLLKGVPKKNCIVFYGPADTGKSYFCMSLLQFLGGAVISYANSSSHFWLQPLSDSKIGLLDDATPQCWSYIDTYLRNLLDGNPVSIDRKHKTLLQLKCPPLMITTNINPLEEDRWKYLRSRLTLFTFNNPFPFASPGEPLYPINNANWKCFFQRSWSRLDLNSPEEQDDNGNTSEPFRCVPGDVARTL
ncbi:E1 protein [Human papillomavirus type 27b]|uniref:Replication protein E1 n=1 Tax=Human papillomavirus type 27b TaxID=325568 RepID=Q4H2F1_HPV27|nr:E1 protein [Human papillomavirus type 27b]